MPVTWSSPVRFVECDQQGVVFNAHYLVWADEASMVWWAAVGLPWDELVPRADPVVKASSLEWSSAARWGDTVTVDAEPERLGRSSLTVRFTVRVGERVCCAVRTTYVAVADGVATPWPDDVRARLADALSAG
ncbi:acyl-CoA thioester hydrolase [Geodermatophilus telluris]|uniref:Acyl-CoA thioester hydrolase n=1 Tax=Geodermatophilus telluris TaxID=1190417 RepID=A0A1G6LIU1_9ACTN|nr:thioesterase family protein [Geodermatophilus telluris]SDC42526.1 acyl-CoA thioester hydrolase [Geodermatophilus telluris]